jgi:hypothetical protein
MKKLGIWGIIGVIAFAGCSKAPLPTETGTQTPAEVVKSSKIVVKAVQENSAPIDSATVFLNGEYIGLTPLNYELKDQGIYAVRVQKQQFQIYSQSLEVRNGEAAYVEALLQKIPGQHGQLLVTVNQDSCEINLSNNLGTTVQQKYGNELAAVLPTAGYFIKVNKLGYKPIFRATHVVKDSITIENLLLEQIEPSEPPQAQLLLPDSVKVNLPVLVEWRTSNAERVDVDYITAPGLNGKQEIIFKTAGLRSISLTAYNEYGSVSVTDSVWIVNEISEKPAAPVLNVDLSPKVVRIGEPVRLTWQTNGKYVMIDQGVGTRGSQGSEEIRFLSPGTKVVTVIAYGKDDQQTVAKDSVYVKQPQPTELPVISLSASDSAAVGKPVVIEWRTGNATQVDIDYLGQVGLNGKSEILFDSPGVRVISATAYNSAGQVSVSDTVAIYEIAPEPEEPLVVEPIEVGCKVKVCAYHQSLPKVAENAAVMTIQVAGKYRVQAKANFDSGDDQKNESFFILLRDAAGDLLWPSDPNAGPYKVVLDEPGAAHISWTEAGFFNLPAEKCTFEIHHFGTISPQYPELVIGGPIKEAESVEILGFRIEYLPE